MIPMMEEIILTCLVLTGSVQISDNVTLVCAPPTEFVEEDRESGREGEQSDSGESRPRLPERFIPPDEGYLPRRRRGGATR